MSDLDLYPETAFQPEGPPPGADLEMITTGVIVELDRTGNRVRVSYRESAGVWLGALPGQYLVGRTCWVLCNPLRGGQGVLALAQIDGGSTAASRTATLVSIDSTARTGVVTLDGETWTLPYVQGVYAVGALVWVLLNPARWGAPELIVGPWSPATPPTPEPPPDPVPVPPEPPSTQQVTTTIRPQWSGTWRSARGAWDRWNVDRYGGRSDLYQGDRDGSGPLMGLATYGSQIANLGAISIDAVTVDVIGNGGSYGTAAPVFQGAPHVTPPAGAPTPSGETSGPVLPASVREAMRVGNVASLALVGGAYLGIRGTSHPAGMALNITYTRTV